VRERETLAERIYISVRPCIILYHRKSKGLSRRFVLRFGFHAPAEWGQSQLIAGPFAYCVGATKMRTLYLYIIIYIHTGYFPSRPKEYHLFFTHLPLCTTFMRVQSLWACPRFDDLNLNHCKYITAVYDSIVLHYGRLISVESDIALAGEHKIHDSLLFPSQYTWKLSTSIIWTVNNEYGKVQKCNILHRHALLYNIPTLYIDKW